MDILGLWDLDRVKLSLGGALIFAEELASLATLHEKAKASVFFTGSQAGLPVMKSPIVSALSSLSSLESCNYVSRPNDILQSLGPNGVLWSAGPGGESKAGKGSFLYLRDFYDRHGRAPRLSYKSSIGDGVKRWMRRRLPRRYPVAVHMKNSGGGRRLSNAHWPSWRDFFKSAMRDKRIAFVLVGNDPIPSDIAELPNVVSSKCEGLSLPQELALIAASYCFMGMSSGPAQAAVFSDVPYVLFKHPAHHPLAMKRELEGMSRFRFANAQQRFVRESESANSLMREFRRMDTRSNRLRWERI